MNETFTGGQYSLYRILLGTFLIVHFGLLLPYGAEVFARGGVLESAMLSPYIGALPNPLAWIDSPVVVSILLTMGALGGLLVAIGWFDRIAAIAVAVLLAWLFQRNPLIANPSLPLLGWLLVMHAFVPPRPYGSFAAVRAGGADAAWRMPQHLHIAAWTVLAIAYTHSGVTKLFSESWVDGQTIRLVLENPLARDHALREVVLSTPPIVLELLTWGVLWIEVLFAPLVLFQRLRPIMWTAMLLAQLGFLCFLNFADLTFPMLLAHLITFDPAWVRRWTRNGQATLLFDGDCAFCHATVRFALAEDRHARLRYAPLSSELARKKMAQIAHTWKGDTIVLISEQGYAIKSRAVAAVLEHLGGLWTLVGRLLRLVPVSVADAGYDLVGKIRYTLGGRHMTSCPILPPSRLARERSE